MDNDGLAYENFSYYGGGRVGMLKMYRAGTGELQQGKGFHINIWGWAGEDVKHVRQWLLPLPVVGKVCELC